MIEGAGSDATRDRPNSSAALLTIIERTMMPGFKLRAVHGEAESDLKRNRADRDARLISFGQRLEAAIRAPVKLLSSKKPRRFLDELRPRFDVIARLFPELRHHLDREWRFFESSVAEREEDWPRVERLERRLLQSWPRSDAFGRSVRYILLVDAQLHQGKIEQATANALRAFSERGDPISHEIIFRHVTDRLSDASQFVLDAARALLPKSVRLPPSSKAVRRLVERHLESLKRRASRSARMRGSVWKPPKA